MSLTIKNSFWFVRYSGSSSQRGAPPRPAQQSPLPQPHPELPLEMEAEDSLELQLQQWSLARFAVAAVEHALPLIRTGESPLKPSFLFQMQLQLLPFPSHVCFHRSSYSPLFFFSHPRPLREPEGFPTGARAAGRGTGAAGRQYSPRGVGRAQPDCDRAGKCLQ